MLTGGCLKPGGSFERARITNDPPEPSSERTVTATRPDDPNTTSSTVMLPPGPAANDCVIASGCRRSSTQPSALAGFCGLMRSRITSPGTPSTTYDLETSAETPPIRSECAGIQ